MDGKHEYPLSLAGEDYGRSLGDELYGKYWIDRPGLWPDNKTSRQHHQQLQELMKSSKWEFQYHKVTCSECHDPHNAERKHIRPKLVVDGAGGAKLEIKVNVEDNTLCLACHAGFGPFASLTREMILNPKSDFGPIYNATIAHTRHPYAPEGAIGLSRCTECHMARMAASGDPYDISSHTFEVVPPAKTLQYQAQGGMPNSCAVRCHRTLAPLYGLPADTSITNWAQSSDRILAEWLNLYYGPNGTWWQTPK